MFYKKKTVYLLKFLFYNKYYRINIVVKLFPKHLTLFYETKKSIHTL